MQQIRSRDELEAWLKDKPADWAQVIAVRVALRALPYLNNAKEEWLSSFATIPFRAIIISWVTRNIPAYDITAAAEAAAYASDISAPAAYAAIAAAYNADAAYAAAAAAYHVTNSYATAAPAFWNSIQSDCRWLTGHADYPAAPRMMTRRSLWLGQPPQDWLLDCFRLVERLLAIDPNYSVWIDWYKRRIRGERSAFDIPGDKRRVEDKKILRRLAEATDADFWGKGHEYVNATLKGWIEEARARVAPPPPESKRTPAQIVSALERQASPQAQIVDGRLDAVPNTIFDKPQYSDTLADLPSELMAYTSTIISSLPTNCEPLVRNCFKSFNDELLVRGNRPILNILKGMAASLQAELYISADENTSPDHWQIRDPREWGPGMGAMFAHFFKGYLDLINHFPLDKEREDLIANTPIDAVAASGAALTAPVDAVADEVAKLGAQGAATDNFVRIIEALRLYNRDLAQLPQSSLPSKKVTPKWRHVLMVTGFFVSLYNFVGSTASIYSIGAEGMQGLLAALKAALDKLISFIR
jgi:hypothetical protein